MISKPIKIENIVISSTIFRVRLVSYFHRINISSPRQLINFESNNIGRLKINTSRKIVSSICIYAKCQRPIAHFCINVIAEI